LEQESSLLASLPSLKALMTTSDPRTIADDAVDFWKTSGNDLFALADADSRVLDADAQGAENTERLKSDLQSVIDDPGTHYLLSGGAVVRVLGATSLFWQRGKRNAARLCGERLCRGSPSSAGGKTWRRCRSGVCYGQGHR
jgi:hypothetical protein